MTKHYSKTDFEIWVSIKFSAYRSRSKTNGIPFTLSITDFIELITGSCHYCNEPPQLESSAANRKTKFKANTIDRIENDFGYVQGNCFPCCSRCNTAKSDMTLPEFEGWISRVYHHHVRDLCL